MVTMQYIRAALFLVFCFLCNVPQSSVAHASSAALNQDENIPTVNIRNGEHLNYSRLVFDFTNSVVYQPSITDDKLTIIFDVTFVPEFGLFLTEPLRWISSPVITSNDGLMSLEFSIEPNSEMVHFYIGNRVVVDIYEYNGSNLTIHYRCAQY